MGIVTRPKDENSAPSLHLIRCRSDAALFWKYEIIFLSEIDSHSRDKDFIRMIAQAAFYVRTVNRTLGTKECCLPVFWVKDLGEENRTGWSGQCLLVYEEGKAVCSAIFFLSSDLCLA